MVHIIDDVIGKDGRFDQIFCGNFQGICKIEEHFQRKAFCKTGSLNCADERATDS